MDRVKIQNSLDSITKKWWFLVIIIILFFLPSYSSQPVDPQEIPQLIIEVISNAFIYSYTTLFPVFKIIPIFLILVIILFGDRVTRIFDIYVAVTITLFATLQNMALTENYGFAIVTGNLVVYLLVALLWVWEAIIKQNDFSPQKRPLWKYWVVPVALVAFWFPVNTGTVPPDFDPRYLLLNEAGLTGCMMIPVYLAVLTLYFPKVNVPTMRLTAFAGLITGTLNVIQWFIFYPQVWLMGVLHLPLLLISIYAFVLSLRTVTMAQDPVKAHSTP
jgi:hypothetical protein